MKNVLIVPMLFLFTTATQAQDMSASGNNQATFTNVYDTKGRPLTEVNKATTGTPLLNENWGTGDVKFKNGTVQKNLELQFDLSTNSLQFKKNNENFAFVDPVLEFTMEYNEEGEKRTVLFRSGYPSIQAKNEASLYRVIADGANAQLLNYKTKKVKEVNTYAGPQKKEYQQNDGYFVYNVKTGKIKSINVNKSGLLKALPEYAAIINEMADQKNYTFKTEYEIEQLFRAINQQ